MILPDLNLLIYAYNLDSPQHEPATSWWEELMNGEEPVGLPWMVILGFLRLTTNGHVMPMPMAVEQAAAIIDSWLEQPVVAIIAPLEQQWSILRSLVATTGTGGNLTTDAFLAAIAIEYGATLHSADNDFSRFPDLKWFNPLTA